MENKNSSGKKKDFKKLLLKINKVLVYFIPSLVGV